MYFDSEMSVHMEWLGLCGVQGEGGAGAEIFLWAQAPWLGSGSPTVCEHTGHLGLRLPVKPWLFVKLCPVPSLPPFCAAPGKEYCGREKAQTPWEWVRGTVTPEHGLGPAPASAPWWSEPRLALLQHPQGCACSRMDLLSANTHVPAHRDPVLHFP